MRNQKEIDNWNGAVGERWTTFQEALDSRLEAYGQQVLAKAALGGGMRVLDVGAGCGDLTLAAARAVGRAGQAVGVDISRPMLARARERATANALSNVELVEHDASTFATDEPFDAVISRFGVMFFDDPTDAFANLHRVTKPGGTLTFVCWQALRDNAWAAEPLAAVASVLPAAPPPAAPNAPGPFAFADADRVQGILTAAAWNDVTFTAFTHPLRLGNDLDDALLYSSRIGPAARLLADADDATRARAIDALRGVVAKLAPSFTAGSAVWIVTARA